MQLLHFLFKNQNRLLKGSGAKRDDCPSSRWVQRQSSWLPGAVGAYDCMQQNLQAKLSSIRGGGCLFFGVILFLIFRLFYSDSVMFWYFIECFDTVGWVT